MVAWVIDTLNQAVSGARQSLDSMQGAYPPGESAPAVLVTTPAHQHHELGALLVAATARIEGWRTTYLGPNLPAEEIVAAARLRNPRAVALSITFPGGDQTLSGELEKLGRLLGDEVELIVGGRAVPSYRSTLEQIGAKSLHDLAALREYLRVSRSKSDPAP